MLRNQQQKNLQEAAQQNVVPGMANLRSEAEWLKSFTAPITVTI
jgi:hypothetical protein